MARPAPSFPRLSAPRWARPGCPGRHASSLKRTPPSHCLRRVRAMALVLSPLALRRPDDSERVGALEREISELKSENKGLKRRLKTAMQGVENALKAARRGGAETSSDDEESAPDEEAPPIELGNVCLCVSVGSADAPPAQIPLTDFLEEDVFDTRPNTGRPRGPSTPAKKIFCASRSASQVRILNCYSVCRWSATPTRRPEGGDHIEGRHLLTSCELLQQQRGQVCAEATARCREGLSQSSSNDGKRFCALLADMTKKK